jgi:hypothetical protein
LVRWVEKIRPHFDGGTGPFPKELLNGNFWNYLQAKHQTHARRLHHFNIFHLSARLVIDPKESSGQWGMK